MTAMSPDVFGFYAEAKKISSIDLSAVAGRLAEACYSSRALLRSLHSQLCNDREAVSLDYVQSLLAMALNALPDPDSVEFGELDQFGLDVTHSTCALLHRQATMNQLLMTLNQVAHPAASLELFREVAETLHQARAILPAWAVHWQVFADAVAARGLHLVWLELGNGIEPHPEIHTTESLKQNKKRWKQLKVALSALPPR